MANGLDDSGWEVLLGRIGDGKCTPFLGAGVNDDILPLGREIAEEWAEKYEYPLENCSDLVQVAQFLAISRNDPMFPKERVLKHLKIRLEEWLRKNDPKKFFLDPSEPLSVLAELPLPIYMTTNYDDLMLRALKSHKKAPRRELCRWNKYVKEKPSVFDSPSGFEPTPATPVVFHLHGHDEIPESLVLTEDDYLDFLVNISREKVLPSRIEEALTGASLLFIGYRLADLNFRVIFRGLVGSMEGSLRRVNVGVQLPPGTPEQERTKVQDYLAQYFGSLRVQVYWGTAKQFVAELRDRWLKSLE
jgi:hypothetical protein